MFIEVFLKWAMHAWNSHYFNVPYRWMMAGAEREIEVMGEVEDYQAETLNFRGRD